MSKNYAVIVNETVINVIVADSLKVAKEVTGQECVECDGSFWIGWTRVDKEWIAPVVVVEPVEEPVDEL